MTVYSSHLAYVEKEKIAGLSYPAEDVLQTEDDRQKRINLIDQAIEAGNFAQFKVMIVFSDAEGVKEVETTIWGRREGQILLKNNVLIPIHRILKIIFH
jgi:uncharacterized protein (UPF0248 family)